MTDTADNDCIFCKIIASQLPATKIYEDQDALAFMDIGPVSRGHALVIPKTHYDPMMDTPDDVLQKLIIIVKKIARAQTKGLSAHSINISQANGQLAGQLVPHIHFHVIPRFTDDETPKNWKSGSYGDPDEMTEIAARIRDAISD